MIHYQGNFKGGDVMIKIIDVDYTDICSCCNNKVKIVKLIDTIPTSIDFCESCWHEFVEELKKRKSDLVSKRDSY